MTILARDIVLGDQPESMKPRREQVQSIFHLSCDDMQMPTLPRSILSYTSLPPLRAQIATQVQQKLFINPERFYWIGLADIHRLGSRAIYALDGIYQQRERPYENSVPSQGSKGDPNGHALLSL